MFVWFLEVEGFRWPDKGKRSWPLGRRPVGTLNRGIANLEVSDEEDSVVLLAES